MREIISCEANREQMLQEAWEISGLEDLNRGRQCIALSCFDRYQNVPEMHSPTWKP